MAVLEKGGLSWFHTAFPVVNQKWYLMPDPSVRVLFSENVVTRTISLISAQRVDSNRLWVFFS